MHMLIFIATLTFAKETNHSITGPNVIEFSIHEIVISYQKRRLQTPKWFYFSAKKSILEKLSSKEIEEITSKVEKKKNIPLVKSQQVNMRLDGDT